MVSVHFPKQARGPRSIRPHRGTMCQTPAEKAASVEVMEISTTVTKNDATDASKRPTIWQLLQFATGIDRTLSILAAILAVISGLAQVHFTARCPLTCAPLFR